LQTLTTVPGVIQYKGAKIQMLDLPGIIEGAKDGKGRGRQVPVAAIDSLMNVGYRRGADLFAHLYGAGCFEAAFAQENSGKGIGRIRIASEQAAAKHLLQEEGKGRH
jgi:hypothetical protein